MWLSWLNIVLQSKGSPVQFPLRAHAWVARQVPGLGACKRQLLAVSSPHQCFSPSLFPSFPLSLKINKINKMLKRQSVLLLSLFLFFLFLYVSHTQFLFLCPSLYMYIIYLYVWLTYNKLCSSGSYKFIKFDICIYLWNHGHNQDNIHARHPQKFSCIAL